MPAKPVSPTRKEGGGPGTYDTDRAEALTKTKNISPVMSKEPRRNNFMGDDKMGPGTYDSGDAFGEGAQAFTFPPSPQKKPTQPSPGPGSYSPERAEDQTKNSPQKCSFANQTGRKASEFDGKADQPDYGDPERFYTYPKELPVYSIPQSGEPKDPRADNPGPGEYALDSPLTKFRARGAQF